ncbi:hypothetical protein TIFTF001_029215 [Ficus carica]|uniref:CCHC-type domain-containing protein n=1 Tax=Ficus carica TaxID=3494 RepID=A0AA88J2K9_FICCA|nr:hypothetical protein TIFTF001_029215 [Ficus carica]
MLQKQSTDNHYNDSLEDHLALKNIWMLSTTVELANKAEAYLQRTTRASSSSRPIGNEVSTGRPQRWSPNTSRTTLAPNKPEQAIGLGQTQAPPAPMKPNPNAKPFPDKCFRCNLPGHRSNTCPQRGFANVVAPADEPQSPGFESADDVFNGTEIVEG